MTDSRRRTIVVIVVALLAGFSAALALGLFEGGDDLNAPGPSSVAREATKGENEVAERDREQGEGNPASGEPALPRTEDDPQGLEPGPSGPAPASDDEVAAARAARAYVEAIDGRNGRTLCEAFEPAANEPHERLDVPEERGSCSASFEASFGFEGGDGQPVWSSSEMTQDVSAQIEGDQARVVATVFTEYSDVREPTIEDDIIYLANVTDRWLVVQPSATLYRAVGIADIPLEAFEPPG